MSAIGTKRTSAIALQMSLLAVKRTRVCALQPSALEAKRQVGPNSVGRTNKHDDNVPAL
jgi:hypothetical protein